MNKELSGSQQTTLDIIRIVAAISVLTGHSFSYYQVTIFKDEAYFPYIQNVGVVVFFLLAGFLSAYSLERHSRNHQYTFVEYSKRRIFRILKEYLPGLLFITIIDLISIGINKEKYIYYGSFHFIQFLSNLFMLQNMGPNSVLGRIFVPFGSGRPLWTLSIEWWLYMLVGWAYLIPGKQKRITPRQLFLLILFLFMVIDYLISGRGGGLGFVFLLGILSYYCFGLLELHVAKIGIIASGVAYIAYGLKQKEAYTIYSFIILWMLLCCALKCSECATFPHGRNRVTAFLSKSSFMLYLVHYSIIDLIFYADLACDARIKFCAGIIFSIVTANIMYYLFGEKELLFYLLKKKTTTDA